MRKIIQDLILSERCLLNVALILYRDHPPQDSSFITQIYDFTDDAEEAKKNIDRASASGGSITIFCSHNISNKRNFSYQVVMVPKLSHQHYMLQSILYHGEPMQLRLLFLLPMLLRMV